MSAPMQRARSPQSLTPPCCRDVLLHRSLASEKRNKGKATSVGLGRSLSALAYATSSPLATHKRCVEPLFSKHQLGARSYLGFLRAPCAQRGMQRRRVCANGAAGGGPRDRRAAGRPQRGRRVCGAAGGARQGQERRGIPGVAGGHADARPGPAGVRGQVAHVLRAAPAGLVGAAGPPARGPPCRRSRTTMRIAGIGGGIDWPDREFLLL